jgi:ribonuclease HI
MSGPERLGSIVGNYLGRRGLSRLLVIHFDGACEPRNPGGIATCGWTIREGDKLLASGSQEVRRGDGATNNLAEYAALGLALRWLLDNQQGGGCILDIRGDSQLVVYQLMQTWQCNKEHLQKLRARCWALLEEIAPASWTAEWIPREQNTEADALSRDAYVAATGKAFPERTRR